MWCLFIVCLPCKAAYDKINLYSPSLEIRKTQKQKRQEAAYALYFFISFLAVLCLLNMQFCPTGADIKRPWTVCMSCALFLQYWSSFPIVQIRFSYAAYSIAVKQDLHIGRRLFLYFIRLWACLLCCLKTELSAQLLEKIVDLLWITLFSSVVSTLIRNTMLDEHQIFQLVNWYMPTLTVLYLIFYVSHRIFPKINSGVSFFFPALYSSSLRSSASLMLLQA